jgi:hypothetical protein
MYVLHMGVVVRHRKFLLEYIKEGDHLEGIRDDAR